MKSHLLVFLLRGLLLLLPFSISSQNAKIETLLKTLHTCPADTTELPLLNKLSWEYTKVGAFDSAIQRANASMALGQRLLKNDSTAKVRHSVDYHKAVSYSTLGIIFSDRGSYAEALKNHLISVKIREALHDTKGLSASYNNLGLVYKDLGNYPEAAKNYFASLKTREALGDKLGMADCYNNIGNVNADQGNYTEALNNFDLDLKLRSGAGDSTGMGGTFNNIANVYAAQAKYTEALDYYGKAVKIAEAQGNIEFLSSAYDNIGAIYTTQGKYEEALKNHFAALKLEEETGSKAEMGASYLSIGEVYLHQHKLSDAETNIQNGKKLLTETGNKKWLQGAYNLLAELDSAKGDFKGAYENQQKYFLLGDEMVNEQAQKKLIESRMNFEFEKKEAVTKAEQDKKDSIAAAEAKHQKLFIWFLVAVALAIAFIALLINRGLRQSKRLMKVIEGQRDEITEQKRTVEDQKLMVEVKQKEIVDSITYAKRIQHMLLANRQLLQQKLPEHFILFKPKDIVSGDFYWATQRGNRFYLAACDCTGHGVPGAFMSLLNISFLNEAVNEKNIVHPNEILDNVRKRLMDNMDGGQDGMDAVLLCFESTVTGMHITYAGANNAPTIIRNGKVISLEGDKMPVGKGEKTEPFTLRSLDIQKGDSLYLYTDGYADQFGGAKGKKLKYKQLDELIVSISGLPATEQAKRLEEHFEDWKAGYEQVDDVLVIGVRI